MCLENVVHFERSSEVGVKVVLYCFRLAKIELFLIWGSLEEHFHIWIRFGEKVHIEQVPSRKINLNFLHCVIGWHLLWVHLGTKGVF